MARIVYASETPAVVRTYSVLFMAALPANERVRISYNHINGMKEPLTLSLVALNDNDEPAPIEFFGGYAGPDIDAAAVGHIATASFFRERLSARSRSELLPAQGRVVLIARGFAPQECLCGIFEIDNRSPGPMRVAVVACAVGITPYDAIGMLVAPPATQTHASDDERRFEHDARVSLRLPESSAIAGVLSTFDVVLAGDAGGEVRVDIVLDTKGFASGTLSIDGKLFEVARTPPHTPTPSRRSSTGTRRPTVFRRSVTTFARCLPRSRVTRTRGASTASASRFSAAVRARNSRCSPPTNRDR